MVQMVRGLLGQLDVNGRYNGSPAMEGGIRVGTSTDIGRIKLSAFRK